MECFELEGIRGLAQDLGLPIPKYDISSFIQGKMGKVRTLVCEAHKPLQPLHRLQVHTLVREARKRLHLLHPLHRLQVRTLVREARKRPDCQEGSANAIAIAKVEDFAQQFTALTPADITSPEAWHRFVCKFTVREDWAQNLEFGSLLSNFGFEATTAKEIAITVIHDRTHGYFRYFRYFHILRCLSYCRYFAYFGITYLGLLLPLLRRWPRPYR